MQSSGNPSPRRLREGGCIQSGLLLLPFPSLVPSVAFLFHIIELPALSRDLLGNKEFRGYCYIAHCSFTWINQFQDTHYRKDQNWQPLGCWRGQVCTVSPPWFVCPKWQRWGVDLGRGRIVEGDWIMAAPEKALCWPFGVNWISQRGLLPWRSAAVGITVNLAPLLSLLVNPCPYCLSMECHCHILWQSSKTLTRVSPESITHNGFSGFKAMN